VDQPWAELRESHSAVVLLAGDRAYKLKKPVSLGFLDYGTRSAREAACRREVELNRRLAPDVYLGVGTMPEPASGQGEPVVVMRRMPEHRRLSTLAAAGEVADDDLRRIARTLAAFHAGAERSPQITVEGGRDALRERWLANFRQARAFHQLLGAAAVREVERLALRFLAGRGRLLDLRQAQSRVVDGHGDLLADDIFCLPDGPRLLDCLEFDDRLRYVDQLDDVAFLAMDLERLGAPGAAAELLHRYLEFSGDPAPASLVHHYVAYRAFVRAKVGCLRYRQGDPAALPQTRALVELAGRHLRAGRVRLVLVGGLPGTGKSTLAGALADRLGAVLVSSDAVRRELAGVPPDRPEPAPFGQGLYTPELTRQVYAELLLRAQAGLRRGESVLLDASWTDHEHREAARDLARRVHAELVGLRCQAPDDVVRARLVARRGPASAHGSDAGPEVAATMAALAADRPWPQAVPVDTSGVLEQAVQQGMAHLSA
jgi:uncharacterized protein